MIADDQVMGESPTDGNDEEPTDASGAPGVAPRIATAVIAVVSLGFCVNAFMYVAVGGARARDLAIAIILLVALLGLQLLVISAPAAGGRPLRLAIGVGALGLLVLLPIPLFGMSWFGLLGFLAGGVLLAFRRRSRWWGWALFATTNAAAGVLTHLYEGRTIDILYFTVVTAVSGLTVFGLSRLVNLVSSLRAARAELAELAVARERLRLATDLGELLGERLSAIVLRCELARRLVDHPHRSREELAEVVNVARRALTDVRSTARTFREVSLRDNIASARAFLASAGVEMTVQLEDEDVDPETSALLVRALRAAVDNALRHGRPRNCVVKVLRTGPTVRLEVVNDGADPSPAGNDPEIALERLAAELRALDGSLRLGSAGRDCRYLRVELPAVPGRRVRPLSARWLRLPHCVHASRRRQLRESATAMEPDFARGVVVSVLVGYAVSVVALVPQLAAEPGGTVAAAACASGTLALQLGYFSRARRPLGRRRYLLLLVQVMLIFLPTVVFGAPLLILPGFASASALLVLDPPVGWLVVGTLAAAASGTQVALHAGPVLIGYGAISTINQALVVWGLTRLRSLVSQLVEARADLASAAVTQERLRFARDLHDLLGYSLSAITLKTELAGRMVEEDPYRARTELSEVLAIAGSVLDDLRAVAGTYRGLTLSGELASVTSLMESADIDVLVRHGAGDPPLPVAAVLATVLRESVTNLLRHSEARTCVITIDADENEVSLVVENDGAPEVSAGAAGIGIVNLTERLQAASGSLEAVRLPGRHYQVRARVPVTARPGPAPGK